MSTITISDIHVEYNTEADTIYLVVNLIDPTNRHNVYRRVKVNSGDDDEFVKLYVLLFFYHHHHHVLTFARSPL
jgi:hypothetical protein